MDVSGRTIEAEFGLGNGYDYNYDYGIQQSAWWIADQIIRELINYLFELGNGVLQLDSGLLIRLLRTTGTELFDFVCL